jgi:hypothetical protein
LRSVRSSLPRAAAELRVLLLARGATAGETFTNGGDEPMGLDYSYQLYFQRDKLWPVLQSLAGFADSSEGHDQIDIVFPDGRKFTLPFSSSDGINGEHRDWNNKTQPISFEDTAKSIQFNTALYFEIDEVIEAYMQETQKGMRGLGLGGEHTDWMPRRDHQNRYSIGYIYLTVGMDLNTYRGNEQRTYLICFDFMAATTRMSLLFEQSTSIRKTFIRLLEEHEGVCCLFDDKTLGGTGWLIWPGDYGKGNCEGLKKRDELIMAKFANQS